MNTLVRVLGTVTPPPNSVLTDAMRTTITNGMTSLSDTVSDVLLIAVPVIVGVIALGAGVNFAMSKVRSVASWAS